MRKVRVSVCPAEYSHITQAAWERSRKNIRKRRVHDRPEVRDSHTTVGFYLCMCAYVHRPNRSFVHTITHASTVPSASGVCTSAYVH
jgi:hypothetical protein